MSLATDSVRIALLHRIGARVEGARATLWYPRDSISETRAHELTRMLDSTIRSIERFVGGPYAGQGRHERITYYLLPEPLIAYTAPGPNIFATVSRLRADSIPFVHETAHAVLYPAQPMSMYITDTAQKRIARAAFPTWLWEGIPEFVAKSIAPGLGLPEFDAMQSGGLKGVDTACAAYAADPRTRETVAYIGQPGNPPRFMQDRVNVAHPFYVCSFSFTKYLVSHYGLPAVIKLFYSDHSTADLETLAGTSVNSLREDWLGSIRH